MPRIKHSSTANFSWFYLIFIFSLLIQQARTVNDVPPSVHDLALRGDVDGVKKLLDQGVSVEALDSEGYTPISGAVFNNHTDVVRELLARGANPNKKSEGVPLIFLAINNRNIKIVEMFADAGADLSATFEDGYTPLMRACLHKDARIIETLVKKKAPLHDTLIQNGIPFDALNYLFANDDLSYSEKTKILKLFLEHGFDINKLFGEHSRLSFVFREDRIPYLILLIQHGADINAPFKENRFTPIAYAVHENQLDIAATLITLCADVKSSANQLLTLAFINKNPDMVLLLANAIGVKKEDLATYKRDYPKTFADFEDLDAKQQMQSSRHFSLF